LFLRFRQLAARKAGALRGRTRARRQQTVRVGR
jgi:hypothetical protein